MDAVTDESLREMVKTIVTEVQPERIVLFGSRSTGHHSVDSDVDLLIIEREPYGKGRSRRARQTQIWQALDHFQVGKDILCYSLEEVERLQKSPNHILGRAMSEGRLLYARS